MARTERRSFRRLRRAARTGACDQGASSATAVSGAGGSLFAVAWTKSGSEPNGDDKVVVGGVEESGGDKRRSTQRQGLIPGGAGFVNDLGDDLRDVAGIVLAISAAALLLALFVLQRKGALERPAWLRRPGR